MRILMMSRLFYPHIGGVEKHVYEVSQELIKQGHTIIVVTEHYDATPEKELYKGIEIYRIPVVQNWFKKFYIWFWFIRHLSLIKKADVVHAHDVFFWYLPFRFLFPRKKVFTTFHGYETVYPPQKKAILIRKFSEFLSRGNICIGSFIEKWYGTKANVISYGGIHPEKKKKDLLIPKNLTAVFIGRIEKDTGIPFYEKTIGKLVNKGFNIKFLVYGEGSLQDKLSFGEYKGVTNDVNTVLRQSDILFSSSYLSILDGLNNQKIVVSTYDNPLKKDYLINTPLAKFILIENDINKLTEKLTKLIVSSDELHKKVNNAKKWVNTQTWKNLSEQYINLWSK